MTKRFVNAEAAGYVRRAWLAARRKEEACRQARHCIAPGSPDVRSLRRLWRRFIVSAGSTLRRLKALGFTLETIRHKVQFVGDDWPAWIEARRAARDLTYGMNPDELIQAAAHLRESHTPQAIYTWCWDAQGTALLAAVSVFASQMLEMHRAGMAGRDGFNKERTLDEILAGARAELERTGECPDSLGKRTFPEVLQLANRAQLARLYRRRGKRCGVDET